MNRMILFHSVVITLSALAFLITASCGGGGGGGITIPVINDPPDVANTNFEEAEAFSLAIPVINQDQLVLTAEDGTITVTGVPGQTTVQIDGVKRVQSESSQDALDHLAELTVEVDQQGTIVNVRSVRPLKKGGRNYIIDYDITLPDYFESIITLTNGNIEMDSLVNDISVVNLSGDILLSNIQASTQVDLLAGVIDAQISLPLNGTIDLRTLAGDINLSVQVNTTADLTADVTLGSINVSNLVINNLVTTPTTLSGIIGSGQGIITLESDQIGDISITGF